MGLRCRTVTPPRDVTLPLSAVDVSFRSDSEGSVVECSTENRVLFKPLYSLIQDIADRIQLDRVPALDAIRGAIDLWELLLRRDEDLSLERQIGLWGELWFLELAANRNAGLALTSWVGPRGEAHDFRGGNAELEVKTTIGASRVHTINSLDQLVPSPGCSLIVLSLTLKRSGAAGISLPGMVGRVRDMLEPGPDLLSAFNERLHGIGYGDESGTRYQDKYDFRLPPGAMLVTDGSPRVTRALLDLGLGQSLSSRILDVRYRLNLDGIVVETPDPTYYSLLTPFLGYDS